MHINKQQAIELRKQGYTYKQISGEIGCSVDWCKRNLSKVPKDTKSIDAYVMCRQKAQSKEGITNNEIQQIIKLCYPEFSTYKQIEPEYKRIKRKLHQDKQSTIRPYWMIPNKAQQCLNSLLISVNTIEERINDEINMIRSELDMDDTYTRSLLYSLISLTSGGTLLHGRPIDSITEGLQSTIDSLEYKNSSGAPSALYNTMQPKSVLSESVLLHQGVYTENEGVFDDAQVYDMPDSLPIEAYL